MTHHILIVDDDALILDEVGPVLRDAGFEVALARDPSEALRSARAQPPAIVLIEVLLAGHDGYALAEQLMAEAAPRPLPVIVVTRGDRTPELFGRGLELGVEDFLCKPVTRAQVLEAVLDCARTLDVVAFEGEATRAAQPSFSGDLRRELLPSLLGRLWRAGMTGVLTIRAGGTKTGAIELRNGTPIRVSLEQDAESFAVFLRQTGRIDAEQYELLIDHLMARLAGPREILLGMGALDEDALRAAADEQARGLLEAMCGWPSGGFRFDEGATLDAADSLEIGRPIDELIANGTRQLRPEAIRSALDGDAGRYVFLAADPSDRRIGVGLTSVQRKALLALTGERTLAEVLATTALDEPALYQLWASGRIAFEDVPLLVLDEELKPESPDAPLLDLDPEDALMGPDLSRQRLPRQRVVDDGTTESSIRELAERLDARDDFALFRIDASSSDADVRREYDRLRAYLVLDRIPQELDALRALATGLAPKLDQAYGRVRTAELRTAFAGLRRREGGAKEQSEAPSAGDRAREAESWFRTGEGHLAHAEYEKAVEAFGMAVHCDPSQGDYHAHLGYALHQSDPGQEILRREALEHVAKGVKLAPGREKPLLFLARIFRESGETETAAKVLRRALRLSPDNPALVQEMCLIEGTSARSKRGFLERFRRR